MVIELVRKEMINRRAKKTSSIYARLLKAFLKLIFYGIIVALVSFVFSSLDNKIQKYSSYGTFDFLVLFLFVAMIIGVLSTVVRARKIIFNKEDTRITMPLTISNETLIFSKVIYLYIKEALCSNSGSLLSLLCKALLSQKVYSCIHIAVCLCECLFAIHHAATGFLS